uniref:DNA 5'-3' helicase n=1 Tax=Ditylenchus dipsaci TaxID=166011 RepID=A0A915EJH3_9BILA
MLPKQDSMVVVRPQFSPVQSRKLLAFSTGSSREIAYSTGCSREVDRAAESTGGSREVDLAVESMVASAISPASPLFRASFNSSFPVQTPESPKPSARVSSSHPVQLPIWPRQVPLSAEEFQFNLQCQVPVILPELQILNGQAWPSPPAAKSHTWFRQRLKSHVFSSAPRCRLRFKIIIQRYCQGLLEHSPERTKVPYQGHPAELVEQLTQRSNFIAIGTALYPAHLLSVNPFGRISSLFGQPAEPNGSGPEFTHIDNVCIESMSVHLNSKIHDKCAKDIEDLDKLIKNIKDTDSTRLQLEYEKMLENLKKVETERPNDRAWQTLCFQMQSRRVCAGNIRNAEHFMIFNASNHGICQASDAYKTVQIESPASFLT